MQNKNKKAAKAKRPSTQAHLPIAEIKDDTVILKDGTLRSVLLTSSVNFALKSEDEQNALISGYVGFLNSIEFPLQIVIQSRKLQIEPYLQKLIDAERSQPNELLRVQIADYRAFMKELVEIGQIMTKKFYVIVPFDPLSNKKKSFWARFQEVLSPAKTIRVKEERFLQRKEGLETRVRSVVSGLQGMGLQVTQLDTQSLIELYYSTYNPQISFQEKMHPLENLQFEDV